jgi:hypothetical protein
MKPPTLVPLAELAREIGVSDATLRQRVHRGTIDAWKIGPMWVVTADEAERVRKAGRGRTAR